MALTTTIFILILNKISSIFINSIISKMHEHITLIFKIWLLIIGSSKSSQSVFKNKNTHWIDAV